MAGMALVLFAGLAGMASFGAPVEKIAPVIEMKAEPFPLEDVRLLDSPFRDAMLRDKSYLLSLDATGCCTIFA